jgi:hypothetical protein
VDRKVDREMPEAKQCQLLLREVTSLTHSSVVFQLRRIQLGTTWKGCICQSLSRHRRWVGGVLFAGQGMGQGSVGANRERFDPIRSDQVADLNCAWTMKKHLAISERRERQGKEAEVVPSGSLQAAPS